MLQTVVPFVSAVLLTCAAPQKQQPVFVQQDNKSIERPTYSPTSLPNAIVYVDGMFNDELAQHFEDQIVRAILDGADTITVSINSPGGHIDALEHMILVIEATPVPISTACAGDCASAAALLLMRGVDRCAVPDAKIMIHEFTSGLRGTVSQLEQQLDDLKKRQYDHYGDAAENIGQPRAYLNDLLAKHPKHEIYMDVKTATSHGIVRGVCR